MSWNCVYLSNLRTIDNGIDLVAGCMASFYLCSSRWFFVCSHSNDERIHALFHHIGTVHHCFLRLFFCSTSSNTIGLTNELLCFVYAYWPLYWTQRNHVRYKWKMTSKSSSIRWKEMKCQSIEIEWRDS